MVGQHIGHHEILAALDHPNIVTIYSVEAAAVSADRDEPTVHFLTMQLVEGKPLSELIPAGGMTLERIFEIAIPLADALAVISRQSMQRYRETEKTGC